MNTAAYSWEANRVSAATARHACEEASRIIDQVQRVALDSAENPLFSVPIRLIPYVERIRSLRRELAHERAARAALREALARLIDQLESGSGAPIAPEKLAGALRALGAG